MTTTSDMTERHGRVPARLAELSLALTEDVQARRTQVRIGMERMIYRELKGRAADVSMADLDERLECEALFDDFLDEDLYAHVDRLSAELGLTGEVAHAYVPGKFRIDARHDEFLASFRFSDLAGIKDEDEEDGEEADDDRDDPAPPDKPADPGWPANGRLAPPMDLPSWETG